jgi:hypothetical protein
MAEASETWEVGSPYYSFLPSCAWRTGKFMKSMQGFDEKRLKGRQVHEVLSNTSCIAVRLERLDMSQSLKLCVRCLDIVES